MVNKQLSFRIDSATFELLETYAKILGQTRSHIILEALKLYLNVSNDDFDNKLINEYSLNYDFIINYICNDYKNWDYIQSPNAWECGYTQILNSLKTKIIKSYFHGQQLMLADDFTYFFPIEIIENKSLQIIFDRSLGQRSLAECNSAGSDRKIDDKYINKVIIKELNKII